MQRGDHDDLTAALVGWAETADGVLGLVLLGSTAATSHLPDDWSDHDFFVIAAPAAAERLRDSTAWLPRRRSALALHERDTAHGAWAVYDDGHLLEYAVFTPDELSLSRSDAHRVAVDRLGDLAERIRPTLAPPEREPRTIATGLHRALLVGGGRAARGERLVAHRHLLDAAGSLLVLAHLLEPAAVPVADAQDPWRRAEQTHPALAAALERILARGGISSAIELAELAERVAGAQPWWPSRLAAAVRARLARADR
ncbi:hypothetical protein [Agrococcus beijingensis]|uniref:hypothetical protein n=1 Tax=Agrococcus beijingensis TaxID=3068634 RepID=UPI002742385C|nr:hypothetical protein [Agrococcus sp. REN33]